MRSPSSSRSTRGAVPAPGCRRGTSRETSGFALHIGHGEFPRIVLASGDLEEAFYDTAKAFNYAEKYQVPVIHIVDKAMANSDQTYPMFDPSLVKIERGELIRDGIVADENAEFLRFKRTESGISPRPAIGTKGGIYWNTGDEHDEKGHISEDPTNRDMMMEKRMSKLNIAAREIPLEEKVHFFGPKDAQITLVSWGSPKGAILDAMEVLKDEGITRELPPDQAHQAVPHRVREGGALRREADCRRRDELLRTAGRRD